MTSDEEISMKYKPEDWLVIPQVLALYIEDIQNRFAECNEKYMELISACADMENYIDSLKEENKM